MCTTNNNMAGALIPYGLKLPSPMPFPQYHPALTQTAMELQRAQAQLYDYNRLRFGFHYAAGPHGLPPFGPGPHDPLSFVYGKPDPRARFLHEEPKPSHSYIGLIGMGILSSKDKKMVLSDIYQHILDNYAYFRTRGPGWRNSIRHNLSLNDCFIKSGRSANGKGHYWAVHPANVDDFSKGDFRRRRAQRKVRKAMGLAVPDDEDSPSPPPASASSLEWQNRVMTVAAKDNDTDEPISTGNAAEQPRYLRDSTEKPTPKSDTDETAAKQGARKIEAAAPYPGKRRMFDVESLLAPDFACSSNNRFTSPLRSSPSASHSVSVNRDRDAAGLSGHVTRPYDGIAIKKEAADDDTDRESVIEVDTNSHELNIKKEHLDSSIDSSYHGTKDSEDEDADSCGRPAKILKVEGQADVSCRRGSLDESSEPCSRDTPPCQSSSPTLHDPEDASVGIAAAAAAAAASSSRFRDELSRSAWRVPLGMPTLQDRPSAFHSTLPTTMTAWSPLGPQGCPVITAPYPLSVRTCTEAAPAAASASSSLPSLDTAQKWHEAFNRFMASRANIDKNTKLLS